MNDDSISKPRPGEDNYDASTIDFVLQWNDWSTAENRQRLYRRAWVRVGSDSSALAFVQAVSALTRVPVPAHIVDYLTKHVDFSDTFRKAFRKVRKDNWRLGVVVDQTNLREFSPAVTLLKNRSARLVVLYVVGDAAV